MNDDHVPEHVWRTIADGHARRIPQEHMDHVHRCRTCSIEMKRAYMPLSPYSSHPFGARMKTADKSLNDAVIPVPNVDPYYAAGNDIIPLHIQKSLAASPSRWVERNTPIKAKK